MVPEECECLQSSAQVLSFVYLLQQSMGIVVAPADDGRIAVLFVLSVQKSAPSVKSGSICRNAKRVELSLGITRGGEKTKTTPPGMSQFPCDCCAFYQCGHYLSLIGAVAKTTERVVRVAVVQEGEREEEDCYIIRRHRCSGCALW